MENDHLFMLYFQDYLMKLMVKNIFGLYFFFLHFCLYKSLLVFRLLTFYGFSTNASSSGEKIFPGRKFSGLSVLCGTRQGCSTWPHRNVLKV